MRLPGAMDLRLDPGAANFPWRLAAAFRPSAESSAIPSTGLFWRGALSESPLAVAIVGARAARGVDCEMAEGIAAAVCASGGVVISGGAIGVDAAAHRGALEVGGKTTAVLAAGFDHFYPASHRPLFEEIKESAGLATPYAHDVRPRKHHFIARNRIIAGLADLTVVVAAERSSGSLHTVRAAYDCGRVVAAVPGTPGCEQLIAQGAFVIDDPADVTAVARGLGRVSTVMEPSDRLEAQVLSCLDNRPRAAEELATLVVAADSEFSARDVDRALTGLELSRLAVALPGRAYVRSVLGESMSA